MESQIQKLKTMTMKPPIFAESMLDKLQGDMMSAKFNGDLFLEEQYARQIASIRTQLFVEQLPL